MDDPGRWKALDAAGSVASGVVLLAFGGWCGLEAVMLPRQIAMFAELGAVELPVLTRVVWGAAEFHLPTIAAVVLLLGGFASLFAIRDRFRANVYALVVAMLMAALAVIVRCASWIPLFQMIQSVGQ